jgi:hypothetical protein
MLSWKHSQSGNIAMTTESFSLIFAGILIHNGMEHIAKTGRCNRAEESRQKKAGELWFMRHMGSVQRLCVAMNSTVEVKCIKLCSGKRRLCILQGIGAIRIA